jgi:mannosyl-glycoprotein endo-beta-N-acetylglucosaminidase
MPRRGTPNDYRLVVDEAPYFDSLDDLDKWAAKPTNKLTGVLEYVPSGRDYNVRGLPCDSGGKLLVRSFL